MADQIGLPELRTVFENATKAVLTRAKKGVVGIVVRDTKAHGVYTITDPDKIPSALGDDNRAYAARALMGSDLGRATKLVLIVTAPETNTASPKSSGEDSAPAAPSLEVSLALLNGKQVDYFAGMPDMTAADMATIKSYVLAYRKVNPTIQAVLPNCAANDRGIINYTSTVHVGAKTFAPAQYCSRIAGALAGLPTTASCTGLELEEVTAVDALNVENKTEEEAQNEAINAGQLIVIHDGTHAEIARGVNSYVPAANSGDDLSTRKIKVTESEGLLAYYANQAIKTSFKGRMINGYDDRCLVIMELNLMLQKLEQQGLLLPGHGAELDVEEQRKYMEDHGVDTSAMTYEEIKTYDNLGTFVFWRVYCDFADTMEDFRGRIVRGGVALDAES